MKLSTVLAGRTFTFQSVKEVLAKANEEKSGDILAGVAAASGLERVAAKQVLSELLVRDLRENPVVPYEEDEVTRLNQDSLDTAVYDSIANRSLAELREYILDYRSTEEDLRRLSRGLTSEVVADACETMLHDPKWVRQLCAENRTLGEKIKEWVDNIIRLLENALKGVTANSEEAKALEASLDDYRKAQELWRSALKSAMQADQAARAAETQEKGRTDRAAQESRQGHTQYQARQNQGKTLKPDMKSDFSTQVDWAIDQANKAADLGKSAKRIKDVLLVGRTPKVLVNCGLNPLPVTITANHVKSIYFAKGDDRMPAGMHPLRGAGHPDHHPQ